MTSSTAPALSEKRAKKISGFGSVFLRGDIWFLAYSCNGRRVRESSSSPRQKDAVAILKQRITEHATTGRTAAEDKKVTIDELLDDLLAQYARQEKKSLEPWAKYVVKPLRAYFTGMRCPQVNSKVLEGYIEVRQALGRANATINNELAILRRAFNLAKRRSPPKVQQVPTFEMLPASPARKGFFEDEDFQRLLKELPEEVAPIALFGYNTGCRKEEILGLRWSQVDLPAGVVRLRAEETKGNTARIVPLAPELLEVLTALRGARNRDFPKCKYVFARHGQRVLDFRTAWDSACERVGKTGAMFHDLRRTGVRNWVRAGASQTVAMAISGHKDASVFRRYNITSEGDLTEAAKLLGKYLDGKRAKKEED